MVSVVPPKVVVLYLVSVTVVVRVLGIERVVLLVLVTVPVRTVTYEVVVPVIDVVPMYDVDIDVDVVLVVTDVVLT